MERRPIYFQSEGETLAGDLVVPDGDGPFPAVLVLMGFGNQNRYGDNFQSGKWKKIDTYRLINSRFAEAGIASLCWDKRGVGESTGGDREPGDPPGDRDAHADDKTDLADAEAALHFLAAQPEIDTKKVAVFGWSGGVTVAGLLAARSDIPAAFVLVAGVHRGMPDLLEFLFDWINPYLERVPEAETWIRKMAPYHLNYARHWRGLVAAARRCDDVYEAGEGEDAVLFHLDRTKQALARPIGAEFQHITKPTLVMHGDRDVNVPVEDCYTIVQQISSSGNEDVTLVVVPRAGHGMRINPVDASLEERRLERITPDTPRHPLSGFFVHSMIGWLSDRFHTVPSRRETKLD
jgi:pimeloyl-ACP methyl ester carboxylesterase